MVMRVALAEIEEIPDRIGVSGDSSARHLAESKVTLSCRLRTTDSASLEALRYARRAMLREQWTRGVEPGEPSLEDAVFSAFEILWSVRADERERCRAKLDELVERANRALEDLPVARRT
jgi:hypothetical protein